MSEERASNVGPSGIEVAFERFGDPEAPPVLLIMGLGAQMLGWHEGFCAELVARGLHAIRFDNRDVGLSTHFPDAPRPELAAAVAGDLSSASYTLSDMAADTVGLLDALGLPSAHVVGASMGGMIGQTMAIEHPGRVRSLTSMMSTTGDRSVGQSSPELRRAMAGPTPTNREEAIERTLTVFRAAGSPRFPLDEAAVRERAGLAYDRAYDPVGVARQALAVLASGDRTARLRSVEAPTLVLHGSDDPVCDPSGGRATAAAIPSAELVIVDGMGHNLPRELWSEIASRIAGHVRRVEGRAAG